ncbi:heterotrimeric G protein alpha subunit 4 [Mycena sp. CBHHK59/15]|nr:heterotrimeric G protein alpha subunit 4 [Mycena sp. CBHHK59/15]
MGGCMSTADGYEVTESEKALHAEAERQLKETRARMANEIKVLLLGSGDSGKSTILKQMRLIHNVPFSSQEVESYRQLVFENVTRGLKALLDAMPDMGLSLPEELQPYAEMVATAEDLRDGEPFPRHLFDPLTALWTNPTVKKARQRGNEIALPENLAYFYHALPRLFDRNYVPTEQDIIQTRARTTGIIETKFSLQDHEMRMVDVGGQKSERRKWVHCFQDVASILFLVSLSGYDQCLTEDQDVNQMQDAMTIWESICHSQWFKQTTIILFLNKNDLFERKILKSNIKDYFSDYEGEERNIRAGRDYFKKRFTKLTQKQGAETGRQVYIHITTATDTALLRVVMTGVEGASLLRDI